MRHFKNRFKGKNKDILFTKFNNKEFKKYYSKLIKEASKANIYSLNNLDIIKSYYQKSIIEFKNNFSIIINSQYYLRNFIENCKLIWIKLNNIHSKINFDDKINDLRTSNNNLKIKMDQLDTKILISNYSDNIYNHTAFS